jgi:hypothetical protein
MNFMQTLAAKLFPRFRKSGIDFGLLQKEANQKEFNGISRKVRRELKQFNSNLELLRGDNIYDVVRLYFSTRGQHSEQYELLVDIPHGGTKEESALEVTRVVNEDILAKAGLRMIRCVMGRVIVSKDGVVGALVNPAVTATKSTYDVLGLPAFCEWFKGEFATHLQANPTKYLTRIRVDGQGNLCTVMETIQGNRNVPDISKFYPNFDFTPADLMAQFEASNSNVILIYGVPGTGKSNFMMEMINARGWDDKIYLADRMDVLGHPGFPDFVRELPAGSIVLTEDSDILVGKRTEGNVSMSALLNATAGIVARDVKLIISTNLTSTRDIDEALLRKGRCFRTLKFKPMNTEQANDVREMMKLEPFAFKDGLTNITLAEAVNAHEVNEDETTSMGFGGR